MSQTPTGLLDSRDRRLLAVAALIMLVVTVGMYIAVELRLPPGQVFSGFLFNTADGWSYAVWTNYFRHQGFLADNPWAVEPRPGVYFNLTWFIAGRLLALGIPFRIIYHLLQIAAGIFLSIVLLLLMRRLAPDRATAWCAYLLTLFGSGFGWLVYLLSPTFFNNTFRPADLFKADGFPVMCWWGFPHITLSWTLLALVYLLMHQAFTGERWRPAAWAGVATLVMGFVHPYHFITILPVLTAWCMVMLFQPGRSRKHLGYYLALPAMGMLPGLLYYGLVIPRAPNFGYIWKNTGLDRPEGFFMVAAGYGLILILAIIGLRYLNPRRKPSLNLILIGVWVLVHSSLRFTYPLLSFGSRLGEGLLIPLSILAALGFLGLLHTWPSKKARSDDHVPWVPIIALVIAVSPSGLFLMGYQVWELCLERGTFLFTADVKIGLAPGEIEALRFLDREARNFPMVMAGIDSGLVLPAYAPVRAFSGHHSAVQDFTEKTRIIESIYGPGSTVDTWRLVLDSFQVDWVWWGPDEWNYGELPPADLSFLRRVFDNGTVIIYRVIRPG